MKKVEVLLSTMYQNNTKIIDKVHINSSAVVVNQTDKCGNTDVTPDIKWIDSNERGLSKSRNLALKNATGDYCLICDDDIEYVDGYEHIVEKAFDEVPQADILIFDSLIINRYGQQETKGFKFIKRVPRFKTYSSVLIAFKRKAVVDKKIKFNEYFGTGSGFYNMCEDAIFLRDCYKNGLKAYTYPTIIHKCVYGESTWFKGYNEKYFFDVGAFLQESYPLVKHIVKWYYPYRMGKMSTMSSLAIIKYINKGMKAYKTKQTFEEWKKSIDGK